MSKWGQTSDKYNTVQKYYYFIILLFYIQKESQGSNRASH